MWEHSHLIRLNLEVKFGKKKKVWKGYKPLPFPVALFYWDILAKISKLTPQIIRQKLGQMSKLSFYLKIIIFVNYQ